MQQPSPSCMAQGWCSTQVHAATEQCSTGSRQHSARWAHETAAGTTGCLPAQCPNSLAARCALTSARRCPTCPTCTNPTVNHMDVGATAVHGCQSLAGEGCHCCPWLPAVRCCSPSRQALLIYILLRTLLPAAAPAGHVYFHSAPMAAAANAQQSALSSMTLAVGLPAP